MLIVYMILTILLLVLTILPKIQHSHWIFRVPEFAKIQVTYLIFFTFLLGFIIAPAEYFWYYQGFLLALFVYHSQTLIRYTRLYPVKNINTATTLLEDSILCRPMFTSSIRNMEGFLSLLKNMNLIFS